LHYHTLCVRIITTYRVYQLYTTLAGSLWSMGFSVADTYV